jgi:hypothetical protein
MHTSRAPRGESRTTRPGVRNRMAKRRAIEGLHAVVLVLAAGTLVLFLVSAALGHAWDGGHAYGVSARVFIGVGPFWWGPLYPYWYYPPPPYYPYAAPPVIVEQPPVYIQREPPQSYWYYCPSARAYDPSVATCPEEWLKVVAKESP